MRKPISTKRFLWAWTKRQFRVKLNAISYMFSSKKKKDENIRSGTGNKRKSGFLLKSFMVVIYGFLAFYISWQTLIKLDKNITQKNLSHKLVSPVKINFLTEFTLSTLESDILRDRLTNLDADDKESRKNYLFKDSKISTNSSEHGKIEFKSHYESTIHQLKKNLKRDKYFNPEDAERLLDHFIAHGTKGFTSETDSYIRADFSGTRSTEFLKWTGLYFLFAILALTTLEGIGSNNPLMHAPEDELEQLSQFPVKTGVLFTLPLLQRTFLNPTSLMFSFPPAVCCFIALGFPLIHSLTLALPVTFLFCLCLASLQICYQFLGKFNTKKIIRTVCSYGQIPGYLLFLVILLGSQVDSVFDILGVFAVEDPGKFIPPALFMSSVVTGEYGLLLTSCISGVIFPAVALSFIVVYSKGGLPHIPIESNSRNMPAKKVSNMPHCGLRLIRDRNYFFQTVVTPVLLFGFYVIMYSERLSSMTGSMALAMLFGAISFVTLGSLLNLAAHEGPALWMVFTASKPVTETFKKTIHFWLYFVSVFYILGIILIFYMGIEVPIIKALALLPGIPAICYMAAALSFDVYPPFTGSTTPPKPKVAIIYLFMFLCSSFVQAVIFGAPGVEFSAPVLFSLLAFAIWQNSKKRIKYFMDPDYDADPELSVKNAMLWCICFFSLQSIIFMTIVMTIKEFSILYITMSYGGAALLTVAFASLWYKSKALYNVPKPKGGRLSTKKGLLIVLFFGISLIGFAWIYTIGLKNFFPDLPQVTLSGDNKLYFFLMAVIMAPLLEEYLFRRLLQVSLLRALSPKKALLFGALVFAAVHPITSFPPVFCLGLGCAWIYWKTGKIWLAVVLHALYNAGIVIIS